MNRRATLRIIGSCATATLVANICDDLKMLADYIPSITQFNDELHGRVKIENKSQVLNRKPVNNPIQGRSY